MGDPQNGWFIMENPIDLDQGYPHFRKPPSTKCLQPCSGNRAHSSWAGIPGSPRSGKAWWELAGEHNLSAAREAADDPKSSQLWRWSSLDHFRWFKMDKMARKEYPPFSDRSTFSCGDMTIWRPGPHPFMWFVMFRRCFGQVMFFRCLHLSFWIINFITYDAFECFVITSYHAHIMSISQSES
jgi:hypothetical protein